MSISITNLNKSYGHTPILKDLSLEIKMGSIFGLLGPNGAGKTTLVSILNHLVSKDSGTIKIDGYDFEKQSNKIKQICSYVPQTYAFYPKLTSYENLEFFGALYGLKGQLLKKSIQECIEATSLESYVNKQAHTYSGGLKRRLNIAIGLLNEPKILYLDEPTVGIDPQSRNYILNVIKRINQEKNTTIIYTSHYMEEIEFLCDDIAILDHGKIILHESKDDLIQQNNQITITLQNNVEKTVPIQEGFSGFIDYCCELKAQNQSIKAIDFGNKSLEQMFLHLTKQDLRD